MAAFSSYLMGLGRSAATKPLLAPAPGTGLPAATKPAAPSGGTVLTAKPFLPPAPTVLGTPAKPKVPKPAAMGTY